MNAESSPVREDRNPGTEVQTHLSARAKAPHDDLALLELDQKFATLWSEILALEHKHERGIGAESRQCRANVPSDETAIRQIESLFSRLNPIEQAIIATPARTIAGLGIKARHAAYVLSEYWDAPLEQIDWDARAVRLLIEAICQAAGVSLPFADEAEL